VYPNQPNGFADHYPYFLWLFHWEYTAQIPDVYTTASVFRSSTSGRGAASSPAAHLDIATDARERRKGILQPVVNGG